LYCSRYFALVLLLIQIVNADSATQTDWSEGSGVLGPVIDWNSQFFYSSDIVWDSLPGAIALSQTIEHTVDAEVDGLNCVYSDDIDGDGDLDVLCSAYNEDDVIWWENENASGLFWIKHIIDSDVGGPNAVFSEDIDGDGDVDVLCTAVDTDDLAWWENADGTVTSWIKHLVHDDFDYPQDVHSEDIDNDGDMDILGIGGYNGIVVLWINIDGSGSSWDEYVVGNFTGNAHSVHSADIDGDGDMDVLSSGGWRVSWWENENSIGTSWIAHSIDSLFFNARSVHSEDIDGDGDMDVLGASAALDNICWWENEYGSGTSWTEHLIDGNFDYAYSVYAQDLDGDSDMDVLGAAVADEDIAWWENANGLGTIWIEHLVEDEYSWARSVYSEDIDGDGNMDFLAVAGFPDYCIKWWDLTPVGQLESSILDTQMDPEWDYLEWNSETPPGTSVAFQIRASDDHTAMGAWSDTISTPGLLSGILADGDQYVQYRTILDTTDPHVLPVLNDMTITWDPMGIEGNEEPVVLTLLPFSPNPASEPAVRFGVPEPSSIQLKLYDLSGRMVLELSEIEYQVGYHCVTLGDLTPGIYFCRMISGEFSATQRFIVIE